MPDTRNALVIPVGKLALYDLLVIATMNASLNLLGIVDPRVLVALSVVRMGLMGAYLWALLEPVRRYQSTVGPATDTSVLEADTALQHLPLRFARVYGLGWAGVEFLAVGLAWFGIPVEAPLAVGELTTGVLAIIAGCSVAGTLVFALALTAIRPLATVSSRAIIERGLSPVRPRARYRVELLISTVAVVFSCIVGFGSMAGKVRIDAIRDQSLTEQRRRAEVTATEYRAGLDVSMPELAIISTAQLPPVLEPGGAEPGATLAAFDFDANRVVAAAPIDGQRWVLAEDQPEEQLAALVIVLVVLSAGFMACTWLPLDALAVSLTDPLAELSEAARRVVVGGDLGEIERMAPRRDDEIGELMLSFNDMLGMFQGFIHVARSVAEGDLSVELERPGELYDAFRAMLAQLHEVVAQLRETALEVASATSEIYASTQEQEHAAQRQVDAIHSASEMATSLATDAGHISEVAIVVLDNAERSLETTEVMTAKLGDLERQTASVRVLLDLIREIADRSDLLALNGALEATRAGDAGRGFALVASEMRRLAERVTGTVTDSRELIGRIESARDGTIAVTEESRGLAEDTAAAARRISSVTHKQDLDTKQVSAATQVIASHVSASAAALSQIRAAAEGLRLKVAEVERLTRGFELRGEAPSGCASSSRGPASEP